MSSSVNPLIPIPNPASHLVKGDPSDIQDARDIKKAKTADEVMTEANTVDENGATQATFKEKLIGNKTKGKEMKLGEVQEIDLDNYDMIVDLSRSTPSIRFSDSVHNEIKNTMKQTIVVQLLARGLGYKGLEAAIKAEDAIKAI